MTARLDRPQNHARAVTQLKALADPARLEIVRLLSVLPDDDACADARCGTARGVCFCHFTERLGLSAPTVSHHLKVLREAELIEGVRVGRWSYYRLRPGALEGVASLLRGLDKAARRVVAAAT